MTRHIQGVLENLSRSRKDCSFDMGNLLKLQDLIEEMDSQIDGYYTVVNKENGQIISVSEDILRKVEDDEIDRDSHPDWEQDVIDNAINIVENEENYATIPSRFDIDEYSIMEDFVLAVKPEKVSDKLYTAIKGRGAFRRFKDSISELSVEEQWYQFKEQRLKEMAIEWCKEEGIAYFDE